MRRTDNFQYPRGARGKVKQLILNSAREAHRRLPVGGRFHISIPSSDTYEGGKDGRTVRNRIYGRDTLTLIKAIGYDLIRVNADIQKRYEGYEHTMTHENAPRKGLHGREYVFEKSDMFGDNSVNYSDNESMDESDESEFF